MPTWMLLGLHLWAVLLLVTFTVAIFRWAVQANWIAGTVVMMAWVYAAVWLATVVWSLV